jgi:hypothetical protein
MQFVRETRYLAGSSPPSYSIQKTRTRSFPLATGERLQSRTQKPFAMISNVEKSITRAVCIKRNASPLPLRHVALYRCDNRETACDPPQIVGILDPEELRSLGIPLEMHLRYIHSVRRVRLTKQETASVVHLSMNLQSNKAD